MRTSADADADYHCPQISKGHQATAASPHSRRRSLRARADLRQAAVEDLAAHLLEALPEHVPADLEQQRQRASDQNTLTCARMI